MPLTKSLHNSKKNKNDDFYTPEKLVKDIIKNINILDNDILYDPFYGSGIFFNNFPKNNTKYFSEIKMNNDFFYFNNKVDWIISNPPFSKLTKVFEHTCKIVQKGFGYILLSTAITSKRLKILKDNNFYITKINYFNIPKWFGFPCIYLQCEKNCPEKSITFLDNIY